MKTLKSNRVLFSVIAILLLIAAQELLFMAGSWIADFIPYQQIDPFNSFARSFIRHTTVLILTSFIILVLSKTTNLNFYFQLGDKKKGMKYLAIYTAVFVLLSVLQHTYMVLNNQLPVYAFPLDGRNIVGTLALQLLLTGPAEEFLFRALPITLLLRTFGKSIPIKWNVTLEVILASILFSFAHASWSIVPLHFEADYFQLVYALVLGTIQGVVYQRTKSILYPVLMHSFSNVLMVGGGYVFTALFK